MDKDKQGIVQPLYTSAIQKIEQTAKRFEYKEKKPIDKTLAQEKTGKHPGNWSYKTRKEMKRLKGKSFKKLESPV